MATRCTASTCNRLWQLEGSRLLILGFGGNAWNGQDVASYLHQVFPEADVMAFHYRGYRPSTGRPLSRGADQGRAARAPAMPSRGLSQAGLSPSAFRSAAALPPHLPGATNSTGWSS